MLKLYIEKAHGGYRVRKIGHDAQIFVNFCDTMDYVVKYFEDDNSNNPEKYEFPDEEKRA